MNEVSLTYGNLFAILRSLGFQERSAGPASRRRHVFFHEETDTILAFGRASDEPVTPADILSTDVHLHAKGIVDRPIAALAGASRVKGR